MPPSGGALVLHVRLSVFPTSHHWPLHSSPRVALTTYHILGGLKKKFIVFQFWRLEVQDHGICRVDSLWVL